MSDRDGAPPAADPLFLIDVLALKRIATASSLNAARDSTTAAARWRLAAWIVAGLEPTREMVVAGKNSEWGWRTVLPGAAYVDAAAIITAALAAAREAGDGS